MLRAVNNIDYNPINKQVIVKLQAKIEKIMNKPPKQTSLKSFNTFSNQMENEIYYGERVYVDESKKDLNEKDIFLFCIIPEDLIVSRCKIERNGIIMIYSNERCNNTFYLYEEISVVGKVVKVD